MMTNASRILVLFAAMLFGGCSPHAATELALDPTLSPEQMSAVIEATDDWCANVPEFCVPVFVGENRGNGYVTHRAKCWDGVGAKTHMSPTGGPTVELCDDDNRMKVVDVIAAHEIGHALSGDMSHIETGGHVMSVDTAAAVPRVTDADVRWAGF